MLETTEDPLLEEAIDYVCSQESITVSMLQRKFHIFYPRAACLIEKMEENGIVGPPTPITFVREVLKSK